MPPKDVEGMANSVDPDLTAPAQLFAQTWLSEYLGKACSSQVDAYSSFSLIYTIFLILSFPL